MVRTHEDKAEARTHEAKDEVKHKEADVNAVPVSVGLEVVAKPPSKQHCSN